MELNVCGTITVDDAAAEEAGSLLQAAQNELGFTGFVALEAEEA